MVVVLEQEIWTNLSPSIIKVELCLVVPANLHPYLSDRSYLAPLAPEFDQVWRFLTIFFPFLEYSIAFSWSERSVLEYDSAGYVCPDVRHSLPDPRLLLCTLACLPQHCRQGEAVPREIWAILNYNYHTKVVQIWSRTTTAEWQKNIIVCNKYEITAIIITVRWSRN